MNYRFLSLPAGRQAFISREKIMCSETKTFAEERIDELTQAFFQAKNGCQWCTPVCVGVDSLDIQDAILVKGDSYEVVCRACFDHFGDQEEGVDLIEMMNGRLVVEDAQVSVT